MAKTLVKIAKELNVGTSTIVDHLNLNGFEIDNKPNAKISDEMYDELLKEFQKSIAIKEQADQLVIGSRVNTKKEDEPAAVAPPLFNFQPAGTPEPKKEENPVTEITNEETTEAAPKPSEPVELEETPIEEPVAEEIKQEDPKQEEPKLEEQAPAEEPKSEEAPAPVEEKEEAPSIKLKVKGKIDLDKLNKPKAKKKSKKSVERPNAEPSKSPKPKAEKKADQVVEEPKETPIADAAGDEVKSTPPPKSPADQKKPSGAPSTDQENEMIRAKTPQLKGLKILGKIDTNKLGSPGNKKKKKKEEDTSSDKKKENKPKSSNEEPKKRRKRTRKRVSVTVDRNRGGGRRTGGRDSGKKRDEVKEVSQKEIEEKIKQTMARMSGGGKRKRQKIRRDNRERLREKQELIEASQEPDKLQLTEFISVSELSSLMEVPVSEVITTCMNLGVIVSINQRLEADVIELVANEFGHEIEFISAEETVLEEEEEVDDPADLLPRAPIVTVMGHVDHGKTSLLDYIRSANVAEGEAGGITQHIGAYEVLVGEEKNKITFLDTPGHEAFTAMRARGAKVTDIAVIIISADDRVMPQTKEAISHAQAAGVPIVFAINKIDKEGAQPDKIKQELASMNLLIEEWGGTYQSQDISAKTGEGIESLLEKILLEAELLELQANPDREAKGVVLEASLDKGRGYVTKILIQHGTLRIGDPCVSGEHSGKVKAMFNERGKKVKAAGPSTPVLILGLSGAPQAGETIKVMDSEQEARALATKRGQISREQSNRANKRISLDEIGRRLALGNFKELNLIIKGDVDGSVEALSDSLLKESIETVQVNVIHKAVGQIIESDVLLASASDAIIIGFQVRPSQGARKLAEKEGVEIKTYSIIYEAIEELKSAIEGMLEPTKEEKIVGQLDVREVYKISRIGTVAGCYVSEGKVSRNDHVRLIRNGIVTYPTKEGAHGELASLKRFKDDVKDVKNGMECGVTIKNFNDIKVGDVIEVYEIVEIKQTLK